MNYEICAGPREGGGGGFGGSDTRTTRSLQRRLIKLKLIKNILNINVQDNQPGAVLVSTIPS